MTAAKTFGAYVAVLQWHDGDTFYGVLDQGRGIFHASGMDIVAGVVVVQPLRHRCALINAPELGTPGGAEATAYAATLVPPGIYPCYTYKSDDTFDRPLIELLLPNGDRFSWSMITAGHAVAYR